MEAENQGNQFAINCRIDKHSLVSFPCLFPVPRNLLNKARDESRTPSHVRTMRMQIHRYRKDRPFSSR